MCIARMPMDRNDIEVNRGHMQTLLTVCMSILAMA
jgi:hypothetical protein